MGINVLKSKKFVCFFFYFGIFCTIPAIISVLTEAPQMDITDIAITGIVDNSASMILVNSENEVYTGIVGPEMGENYSFSDELLLPFELGSVAKFSNPSSAVDEENNMVVFLVNSQSNESYLVHYSNDTLNTHIVLTIEQKYKRLFYIDGFFYLAYHNNSSFQIDRINTGNMTLTSVFNSNKAINYSNGESFLQDISVYSNEIALGIEYRDHTLSDNSSSAYFLLIFQTENVIIHDYELLEPNSIEQISVFDHKVLLWGEQNIYLRDTNSKSFSSLFINGTYEYEMAMTKELIDIVLFSESEFILINEVYLQLWVIEDFELLNYQFGVDYSIAYQIQSNILVDDLGNIYFAYQREDSELIKLKLPPAEFINSIGGGMTYTYPFVTTSTSTSSIPTNELFIFLVGIGLPLFSLGVAYYVLNKGRKAKYPKSIERQEPYRYQEDLIAPKLIKTLCPNCNAKREESDVFCSECGQVL
jgi:hypothetical protein